MMACVRVCETGYVCVTACMYAFLYVMDGFVIVLVKRNLILFLVRMNYKLLNVLEELESLCVL